MDDLISRQAAIDAIQKLNIPEDMCVFEIMSHIGVAIATLPPAQQVILCKRLRVVDEAGQEFARTMRVDADAPYGRMVLWKRTEEGEQRKEEAKRMGVLK